VEPSPGGISQPVAVIDCVLFAGDRTAVVREFARTGQPFVLEEGMSLRVSGRISLWDRGGKYQFIVERVDPDWTLGTQALRLRTIVEMLESENVLAANAELSMPRAPLRVGLVTSEDSAASHDFIQELRESGFPFEVFAAWSQMQGDRAAGEIIRSFNRLLEIPRIDAVVLTRGGGSPTDLAWMNDEHIGRAITQMPWPVISGIGHETDTTLPDFVAHTRAKTPTHAARILVDRVADFSADVEALAALLQRNVSKGISRSMSQLSVIAGSLFRQTQFRLRTLSTDLAGRTLLLQRNAEFLLRDRKLNLWRMRETFTRAMTAGYLQRRRRELDSLERSLRKSAENRLEKISIRLDAFQKVLSASDPRNLYRKGWAVVHASDGTLLRSVDRVNMNDMIRISLADGSITAQTRGIVKGRDDDDRKGSNR